MAETSLLEKASWVKKQNTLYYLNNSGISPESLQNKKILVVGAGGGNFEKDLKDAGFNIDCQIVNVDLQYDPKRKSNLWRLILKLPRKNYPPNAIWADAKNLPFADNRYDIAFAFNSIVPYMTGDAKLQAIKEITRVSKDVYIYPDSTWGTGTMHIGEDKIPALVVKSRPIGQETKLEVGS